MNLIKSDLAGTEQDDYHDFCSVLKLIGSFTGFLAVY